MGNILKIFNCNKDDIDNVDLSLTDSYDGSYYDNLIKEPLIDYTIDNI